ncbi:MAG: hypothetical protein RIC19_19790 [Phaeodactylibacter sp.]|uniref:hypothetical protein n=1 Tax=Phaeodactylibacter sp. TaxID=1940289 RepID=UPI0032EC2D3D
MLLPKQMTCALLLSVLSFGTAMGQPFEEGERSMSKGVHSSFLIDFQIGEADAIADLWVDYQKDFDARKPKPNKAGEYFGDNAEIEAISDNTIDIYSTVQSKKPAPGATVTIWFDLGGAYLSSATHPDRMEGARNWLQGFRDFVLKEYAEEALEAEEDKLKEMEKVLKDARKTEENVAGEIKDMEKELAELKKQLASAKKETEMKADAVSKQKQIVDQAKAKTKSLKN